MRSLRIVDYEPLLEGMCPFLVADETLPAVELVVNRPVEPFDLTVGLRAVGTSELVPDTQTQACLIEAGEAIPAVGMAHGELKSVVGEHSLHSHPVLCEEGRDLLEECHSVATESPVHCLCEGETAEGVYSRDLKDRFAAAYTGQLFEVDPYLRSRLVVDDAPDRLPYLDP